MLRPSPKHSGAAAGQCAAMTIKDMTIKDVTVIVTVWLRRARTRRHLRALEAHRLADIGSSEEARRRECAKWFWQN
ncbi:MAG: DUF1127 domain-containing protein [Pseudolabrys sp.]|nr:DUF1127 domain-containing protein [Pseudolabrys sp.]